MDKNVFEKGIILGIIGLFIVSNIIPLTGATHSVKKEVDNILGSTSTNIVIVDNEGDGDYFYIQDAVDQAHDGDQILVYSGTYVEKIEIDKQLTLIGISEELGVGDDTGNPIIVPLHDSENVITIAEDCCNISYFIIKNGKNGIYLRGSCNNTFLGNNITNNTDNGIYILDSLNNTIKDNIISYNNYEGIYLKNSLDNIILDSTFKNNKKSGVHSEISNNNTISNNIFIADSINVDGTALNHWNSHTIENNSVNEKPIYYYKNNHLGRTVPSDAGQIILANCSYFILKNLEITNVDRGIQLGFSLNNIISLNSINCNKLDGVYLRCSFNNNISWNNIYCNNGDGISMYKSFNNSVEDNDIYCNEGDGISIDGESSKNFISRNNLLTNDRGTYSSVKSNNNTFHLNNFVYNNLNAYDNCNNIWNLSEGNYWSDYYGYDENDDGIGDVPYQIDGGENCDLRPLIVPTINFAPSKPTLWGNPSGKTGESYRCEAIAIDPNGDQIYYCFDWGDGSQSTWQGPYSSNHTCEASHIWNEEGNYKIRVKAKDGYDAEGEWSDLLPVSVPKNKATNPIPLYLENHPHIFSLLRQLPGLQ